MPAQPLTPTAVTAWLARYKDAWKRRDPDPAAALFTESAAYHELPFAEPKPGRAGIRAYWASVTEDQRDVAFESRVVAVEGRTAVARWSANLRSASSGARVELDGVFILVFERDDLCSELREWWHVRTSP